jgi:hypothetical protein
MSDQLIKISAQQLAMVDFIRSRKGQFSRASWERKCATRKGFDNITILKKTVVTVRAGIQYDSMAVVKEARANGDLPSTNQGLNGKQWLEYPYLLTGRDGDIQLRIYPNCNRSVTYSMNGKEVDVSMLKHIILASEMPRSVNIVQDIRLSDMVELG